MTIIVQKPAMTPVRTTPIPMWATATAVPPLVAPASTQGINPSFICRMPPTIQSMPNPMRIEITGRNFAKTWADCARGVPVRSEYTTSGAPRSAKVHRASNPRAGRATAT